MQSQALQRFRTQYSLRDPAIFSLPQHPLLPVLFSLVVTLFLSLLFLRVLTLPRSFFFLTKQCLTTQSLYLSMVLGCPCLIFCLFSGDLSLLCYSIVFASFPVQLTPYKIRFNGFRKSLIGNILVAKVLSSGHLLAVGHLYTSANPVAIIWSEYHVM